jgi:hypothetical protein
MTQVLLPNFCRIVNVATGKRHPMDIVCTVLRTDNKIRRSLVLIPMCGEYWFDVDSLTPIDSIQIL